MRCNLFNVLSSQGSNNDPLHEEQNEEIDLLRSLNF